MDKTHNISLGGFSFIIENSAYQELATYIAQVRKHLGESSDTDEIIFDVEQRMAELLKDRTQNTEVVTHSDVQYLIGVLGRPEQYIDEAQETPQEPEKLRHSFKHKKLYRDMDDRKLGGVLSGMSYYFKIDVTLLRVIFVLLFLTNGFLFVFSASFWLLLYAVFWAVMPVARTTAEKLEMKGVNVNLDTLSNFKAGTTEEKKEWRRSLTDRKIGGVLGGLAQYTSLNSTWIRVGYVIFCLLSIATQSVGMLFPVLFYLFLWYFIKEENFPKESDENTPNVEEQQAKVSPVESSQKTFFLWSFFRFFFKAIGYFIATIFFVIAFSIVAALILSLLGVGFAGGISAFLLLDYAPFLLTQWQELLFHILLYVSLFLFVSVLTLLCFKAFQKGHYRTPRAWFVTNTLLFVCVIVGGFALAGTVSRNFIAKDTEEEKITIPTASDTLLIMEKHTISQYDIVLDKNGEGRSGRVFFLGTLPTKEAQPFLWIETVSRGRNTNDALENAQKITFPIEINDNKVFIPNGYLIKKGDPYRFQEVYIKLFVPEGKKVFFMNSIPYKTRARMFQKGIFEVKNDSIVKLSS